MVSFMIIGVNYHVEELDLDSMPFDLNQFVIILRSAIGDIGIMPHMEACDDPKSHNC